MFLAPLKSASPPQPQDELVQEKRLPLREPICRQRWHIWDVYAAGTRCRMTPDNAALYVMNCRSWKKAQLLLRRRSVFGLGSWLVRSRMPVKSSRARAALVRFAVSTSALEMTWLVWR